MIALDSECPLAQMDADRRTWSGWGGHRSRQVDIWVGRSVVLLTYDSARGPHQVRDELRSMECGRKEGAGRFWDRRGAGQKIVPLHYVNIFWGKNSTKPG